MLKSGGRFMYKILIIEDDFSMAKAMKSQIESWGNEVLCVEDFQNIIKTFSISRYYVTIL